MASVWKWWYALKWGVAHPRIFWLGFREARHDWGITWDNNPCSPRSVAYDSGRELYHVLTLRRYDQSK